MTSQFHPTLPARLALPLPCLIRWVVAGLLVSTWSGLPARAQEADCSGPRSQSGINHCSYLAYETADRALNRAYRQIIANHAAGPDAGETAWLDAMRRAQRAWVAFRDAECHGLIGADWAGGSGQPMAVNTCLIVRTEQRTKTLQTRYLSR